MPKFSEQIVDDSGYQRPVEGALVFLLDRDGNEADTDSPNPTWTDNFGVFSFIADDGVYRFSARMGGVEIARGDALIGVPPEFTGAPGPAIAFRPNLAALRAAPVTDRTSIYDGSLFTLQDGATGADEVVTIASNTAGKIWKRRTNKDLEVRLTDYRLLSDPTDLLAYTRALAALPVDGGKIILPGGKGLGNDGKYLLTNPDGFMLERSGVTLQGDGFGITKVECIGAGEYTVFNVPSSAVRDVQLLDMTVRAINTDPSAVNSATMYFNGAFLLEDWRIRLDFEATPGRNQNCVKIVHDNLGVTKNFDWSDSTFRNGGRMGVELQNHRDDIDSDDRVSRFVNHVFNNNNFMGFVGAMEGINAGISLSGYGSGIHLNKPYFENLEHAFVEVIGAADVYVNKATYRAEDLPGSDALIRVGNFRKNYNININGLAPVTTPGSDINNGPNRAGNAAVKRVAVSMANVDGFNISGVDVHEIGVEQPAMLFGRNDGPATNGRVTGNTLRVDHRYLVSIENGRNIAFDGNLFQSNSAATDVEAVRAIAVGTGASISNVVVGINQYDFPNAGTTWNPVNGASGTVRMDPPLLWHGKATYDAPSIAAASEVSTAVTVTGAKVGDAVTALSFSPDLGAVVPRASVTATDTVTVRLNNPTAAEIDPGSTVIRVTVARQQI